MQKTVIIVDDDDEQRKFYENALGRRGFRAEGAATVAGAYRLIEKLGEEIDVMVLDMKLLDPDAPTTTGADIAISIREQHPDWTPEYLIKTAHLFNVEYYRLAIRLGVTAYLGVEEVNEADVLRHIRALALKRSLRVEHPKVVAALSSISNATNNLAEAVGRFCREILGEELSACLGTPYVLLLSDERGTQTVATNTDLPMGYKGIYAALQNLAHGVTKISSEFVISKQDLVGFPEPVDDLEEKINSRLPGAALLPLANAMNFRLALVLFAAQPGDSKYPEETGPLATVLAQQLRPSIIEHFLRILVQMESQKRAMLKSTSQFCLYIGQEQQRILEEGIAVKELKQGCVLDRALATMADDLRRTGTILNAAVRDWQEAPTTLDMKEMVEEELANLTATIQHEEINLRVEGSCRVSAGDDLAIAVKRLLQWLFQRRSETPLGMKPEINVRCIESQEDSLIIFQDRSRRLPKALREHLFEPFCTSALNPDPSESVPGIYLPLYLAKALVEEKYSGTLTDKSDEMNGDVGHALIMKFRSVRLLN
jgi:ActR/RegA family two-component response regulator/signal transduction histidine kinase